MDRAQKVKGKVFNDLHSAEGIFVMPNAWNAGSARMLEAALGRIDRCGHESVHESGWLSPLLSYSRVSLPALRVGDSLAP